MNWLNISKVEWVRHREIVNFPKSRSLNSHKLFWRRKSLEIGNGTDNRKHKSNRKRTRKRPSNGQTAFCSNYMEKERWKSYSAAADLIAFLRAIEMKMWKGKLSIWCRTEALIHERKIIYRWRVVILYTCEYRVHRARKTFSLNINGKPWIERERETKTSLNTTNPG